MKNYKRRQWSKLSEYYCLIDYSKAFDCVDHNKLWKILNEIGIPHHLTCLLRNLYAGQEATVKTGHGKTDNPAKKQAEDISPKKMNRWLINMKICLITPIIREIQNKTADRAE